MWVVLLIHRNLLYNPPMRNCLEVDSIMKSFGEKTVLTDIYLRCEPGEIIALFGWNGCGKSTLLHIIFGTLACERKFIRINGKVQNKPAYRSGLIAYLPQHDFLPGNLSVKKVAHLYLSQEDEHLFFDDPCLEYLRETKINELSGGELRYLEIKLILCCPAMYLFLDEPFHGVSHIACEAIRKQIHTVSQSKGIILTDHNFREVHKIANRICLLDQGYLREIQDKNELRSYGYLNPISF